MLMRMAPTRFDPAALLRLERLSADLSSAIATERRRRRRLDEAVRDGRDPGPRSARLDRAAARVTTLLAELQHTAMQVKAAPSPASPGHGTARPSRTRRAASSRRAGPGALVASAVDLGSNSVHLLVAVVAGHRLEPLLDVSEFLGLGAAVDDRGAFGDEL